MCSLSLDQLKNIPFFYYFIIFYFTKQYCIIGEKLHFLSTVYIKTNKQKTYKFWKFISQSHMNLDNHLVLLKDVRVYWLNW